MHARIPKSTQYARFLLKRYLSGVCMALSPLHSPPGNGLRVFVHASVSLMSPWFKMMQMRKTFYFHLNAVLRNVPFVSPFPSILPISVSFLLFFPIRGMWPFSCIVYFAPSPALGAPFVIFFPVPFASGLNLLMSSSKGASHCPFSCELLFHFTLLHFKAQQYLPFSSWKKCFPPLWLGSIQGTAFPWD